MLRPLVLSLVLASGCAEVTPWQRETLATDRMSLDGDADEQTMVTSRRRTREEASIGGAGTGASSGGGGCGCN
jgi:hypothetical protein